MYSQNILYKCVIIVPQNALYFFSFFIAKHMLLYYDCFYKSQNFEALCKYQLGQKYYTYERQYIQINQ